MRRDDSKLFLERQREIVRRCVKCGACHAVCPTYHATGDEAQVARGRLSLLEAVLDGRLGITRGLDERLSKCIGCMACDTACPSGVNINAAILAARSELAAVRNSHRLARRAVRGAARGSAGPSAITRLAGAAGAAAYRRLPANRLAPWWRENGRRNLPPIRRRTLADLAGDATPVAGAARRVALFPGCATNLAYPETGLAAIKLFQEAAIEVSHPRALQCCGLPFLSLGDREQACAAAEANLAILSALDVDTVVTVCSSCALMLKELLPELLGNGREEVIALTDSVRDIHELLADEELEYGTGHDLAASITWHDPCHMRHGLGMAFQPQEILNRLAGFKYVEIEPGCCGGGGTFSFLHYDLALSIGRVRAEAISGSGADVVATGCPGCRMHLTDTLRRAGSRTRVVHTVELVTGNF